MNRLIQHYRNVVIPDLISIGNYKNVHQVPRFEKLILRIDTPAARDSQKNALPGLIALEMVTGQRAKLRYMTASYDQLKLRKGDLVGVYTTLRGEYMYTFLDKLITVVAPQYRAFPGFSVHGFDVQGNYNFSIPDITVFPELETILDTNYDHFKDIKTLEANLVTTANTKQECRHLLTSFQFPIDMNAKKVPLFKKKA